MAYVRACQPGDVTDAADQTDGGRIGSSTVTREGTSLAVVRPVRASPSTAMRSLRDTRRWADWSPTIGAVESDDRFVEEGTRGRVRVAGVWVPFDVTFVSGRRWEWRVARVPATAHRVRGYATEPDRCRVGIELPLVAAGYVPVCRRALDRFARLVEDD